MIYVHPLPEDFLDQGDLVEGCPVLTIDTFDLARLGEVGVKATPQWVIVLTQTCDLANDKATAVNVAEVFEAQFLIDQKIFKPADIKGPLRAGRI
jgi:hypothetical protein